MLNAISNALSGLTASSKKADTAASNIANVSSGGALDSTSARQAPYSSLETIQSATENGGVTSYTRAREPGFVPAYDPDSPFANEDGLIGVPNVSLAEEIVDMKQAEISYKANIQTLKAAIQTSDALFDIFDDD